MTYDLDKITDKDGIITVYTDGSFNFSNSMAGSAFVAICHDDIAESYIEKTSVKVTDKDPKDTKGKAASFYAELNAVLLAITHLPPESKIMLFTDNKDVKDFLDQKHERRAVILKNFSQSQSKTLMLTTHEKLSEVTEFNVSMINHKSHDLSDKEKWATKEAHNQAAAASGAKSQKDKDGHRLDAGSSPNALDIINFEDGNDDTNKIHAKDGPMPIIF